jgi:hypothetical protein
MIQRDRIEARYAEKFGTSGNVAVPLRIAPGALIIKEICSFSEDDAVEIIVRTTICSILSDTGSTSYPARRRAG